MTPRQIVAVFLRIFAVWLALQVLRTLPTLFAKGAGEAPGFVYETFLFVLTGAIAVALWFFPSTIAGKLLPSPSVAAESSPTADTWLAMGCTLIGIWTLTSTIPHLVYDALAFSAASTYDDTSQIHEWVASNLVESAIAVWLLLGGKGIRKVFWWAQNAGTNKAP